MTLKEFLDQLGEGGNPLKYTELLQVSGLTSEETLDFKAAWPSIPSSRKREVLTKLVELSEGNMELDFSAAFMVCLDDEDEVVREKAAQGLWDCDDRTIIRPLIRLLEDDPSPKVRAAVGISLGKFAAMAQNGKLLSRDADGIREALMTVIGRHDEEMEVKRRAIEAVASFDVPEIDEIIRGAYHSGDPKLMQSSLYAMGQSSNVQWLPSVIEELDHEHAAIRYEAAQACGLLGDESTVPHLIKLVQDEDTQVQLAAIGALGTVGGTLAGRALLQCLKMGDEALVEAARDALENIEFDDNPLGIRIEI